MDVTKVVVPAGGVGTRLLPQTKTIPKEMIRILDKPAMQYIVEECIASGIKHITTITSKSKQPLVDYFDANPALELFLKERGKEHLTASIEKILRSVDFTYVRQQEPLGLGHAIWSARNTIGKEYFGILLPDDLFFGKDPVLGQLIRIARQERASVIAVREVPMECVSSYGVIAIKKQITPKLFQLSHLVEKPAQKDAPSNLVIPGRYVLSHKIFDALEEISHYATGEIQLTDGISQMLKNGEKVFAYKVQAKHYDIGTTLGWIQAVIGTALQDQRFAPHIRKLFCELDTPDSILFNNTKSVTAKAE